MEFKIVERYYSVIVTKGSELGKSKQIFRKIRRCCRKKQQKVK